MTFRIVLQTDLVVGCIQPGISPKLLLVEGCASDFTGSLLWEGMVIASEQEWKVSPVPSTACCICLFLRQFVLGFQ